MRKRGDEFWTEFEFYLSDMVVGIVMDVLLVTLMAPVAVIGAKSKKSGGATGKSIFLIVTGKNRHDTL